MLQVIDAVLSAADAGRVGAVLHRLRDAGLDDFAVTGGIAIAARLAEATGRRAPRPLNDLDIVVADAAAIPRIVGEIGPVTHVHFDARPGRMLLQLVEPVADLRVDLFGAFGGQLARSRPVAFRGLPIRLVSAGDLLARLTTLLLDLGLDEAVPAKHARDFGLLDGCVRDADAGPVWADHRRPRQPASFTAARRMAAGLIRTRANLLTDSAFKAFDVACARCRNAGGFRVAAEPHSP